MKSRENIYRLKRFQVDDKRRQVSQIELMITDFERMVEELDRQIVAEEQRVGVTDTSHFAYPTFAKAATQRRNNLKGSVDGLTEQLNSAQDALTEAVEEFAKVELLEERNQGRERHSEKTQAVVDMNIIGLAVST